MKTNLRKSIMVFDHDPGMLLKCDLLLKKKGYEVYVSTHTDDIVGQIKTHEPDIILMNSRIPGIGAIEALYQIRTHEPFRSIPVIRFSVKNSIDETAEDMAVAAMRLKVA